LKKTELIFIILARDIQIILASKSIYNFASNLTINYFYYSFQGCAENNPGDYTPNCNPRRGTPSWCAYPGDNPIGPTLDMFHCFMLRLLLIVRNYYYLTNYCN